MDPSDEPTPQELDFLQEFLTDLERGRTRRLSDYLRLFPGSEREVARRYLSLTGAAEAPGADEPPTGSADRVGRYELLEELGRGGQGVVYLARDASLDRRVALKVLEGRDFGGDVAHLRLDREARLLSKLEHPGICPVYDRGRDRGRDYIVMRFLEGEPLDELLRAGAPRNRSELEERLRLVEECARALHAAHEAGVVHRDVKPRNVVVQPDGTPVLLDFGLGREETDVALTRSGEVFGTPDYMSPEQVDGARADRRADVWALGAVLYESLAGAPPFREPTVHVTALSILTREPRSLRAQCPLVSRDLEVVARTALEKDLVRRYQSALDLAEELARVRRGDPIVARRASPLRRLGRWVRHHPTSAVGGALAAAAILVVVALVSYFRGEQEVLAGARDRAVSQMVRISDLELAERLLEREREELWPVAAALVPACDRWLRDEEAIRSRRAEHEELLASLRERRAADGEYADDGERVADERLARLLGLIDELGARRATVLERRQRAETSVERTLRAEAGAWEACVEDVARSPVYGGLALAPQEGLVPLGKNPAGLWELWVVESGERPEWDPERGALPGVGTGVALVLLPGGTTEVGPREDDPHDQANEKPRHAVTLDPFLIGKYELTQGQWKHLSDGHLPASYTAGHPHLPPDDPGLTHPIETVAWADCVRALRRVGLELPTEAQWEYACRAGSELAFAFGNDWREASAYGNFQGSETNEHFDRAPIEESYVDPHVVHAPVGRYAPNAFGLHDVHGNVWEWCRDVYGLYGDSEPRPGDGLRTPAEDGGRRAVRGGTFNAPAIYGRASRRVPVPVDAYDFDLGVRAVRALAESGASSSPRSASGGGA